MSNTNYLNESRYSQPEMEYIDNYFKNNALGTNGEMKCGIRAAQSLLHNSKLNTPRNYEWTCKKCDWRHSITSVLNNNRKPVKGKLFTYLNQEDYIALSERFWKLPKEIRQMIFKYIHVDVFELTQEKFYMRIERCITFKLSKKRKRAGDLLNPILVVDDDHPDNWSESVRVHQNPSVNNLANLLILEPKLINDFFDSINREYCSQKHDNPRPVLTPAYIGTAIRVAINANYNTTKRIKKL